MAFFDLAEDSMSLEDMKQLLLKAEQRLKVCASEKPSPDQRDKHLDRCNTIQKRILKLESEKVTKPYIDSVSGVAHAEPSRLLSKHNRQPSERTVPQGNVARKKDKSVKEGNADAGPDWFHLPRTKLTPTLKRELQILKMRSVLDPKRHYKKDESKALSSDFSQIGTIIQGPTEFYNSRLLNRDRKGTIASEILAMEESTGRFRNKYNNIQVAKTSGKKSFYKNLKDKRSGRVKKH